MICVLAFSPRTIGRKLALLTAELFPKERSHGDGVSLAPVAVAVLVKTEKKDVGNPDIFFLFPFISKFRYPLFYFFFISFFYF